MGIYPIGRTNEDTGFNPDNFKNVLTNQYGQQTTDSGHVLTESERLSEDLRDLLADARFNNDPGIDGLLGANMESEYFEALLDRLATFTLDYGSDMYFKGCRTLLDNRQAIEAALQGDLAAVVSKRESIQYRRGYKAGHQQGKQRRKRYE